MSEIRIDVTRVMSVAVKGRLARNTVSGVANGIAVTSKRLDSEIANRNGIGVRLNETRRKVSQIEDEIAQICNAINSGADRYQNAERIVQGYADKLARKNLLTRFPRGFIADMVGKYMDKFVNWTRDFDHGSGIFGFLDGKPILDEEKMYEIIKRFPGRITDKEEDELRDGIMHLQETVVFYDSIAKIGKDDLDADLLNVTAWISKEKKFASINAVSAHYKELYVNFLNAMAEQTDDELKLAANLVTLGVGTDMLTLLGAEYSKSLGKIFGSESFTGFLAKYETENSTSYFGKVQVGTEEKLTSSSKMKKANKAIKEGLEDLGLRKDDKEEKYYDKNGKEIAEKDAPTFYDREATLLEASAGASASASLYEGTFAVGENGKATVVVGKAEAHAGVSGGLYVIGADGEKKFSPGVKAEVGASVTAFEASYEQQLLGDENLGLNADAKVTAGKASAQAEAVAQVFGEDGKLDVQVAASASAELIGGELEGSVGVNVLGGEVGVKGSVNYGIGAHADVGYKDGVVKCDIGASVGLGVSVGFEVDVGGMVDTVSDAAESAMEDFADAAEDFKDAAEDFKEGMEDAAKEVQKGFEKAKDEMKEGLEDGWKNVKKGWNSLWS